MKEYKLFLIEDNEYKLLSICPFIEQVEEQMEPNKKYVVIECLERSGEEIQTYTYNT